MFKTWSDTPLHLYWFYDRNPLRPHRLWGYPVRHLRGRGLTSRDKGCAKVRDTGTPTDPESLPHPLLLRRHGTGDIVWVPDDAGRSDFVEERKV